MSKIIFLGSDIHGEQTEHATKIVKRLLPYYPHHKVVSIQSIQKLSFRKNTWIVPMVFPIRQMRLFILGILLPFYLILLRIIGYKKIASFWTADKKYHDYLFKFLKIIGYKLFFTVISDSGKDYSPLISCEVIICQNKKIHRLLKEKFPQKNVSLIYPGIDLDIFHPSKKQDIIMIPSCPSKISNLSDRKINFLINFFKKNKLKSKILTRSLEISNFLENKKIPNSKIISKTLTDKDLAKEMSEVKLIPLLYVGGNPEMPLSSIEGLACGCAIICFNEMALAEVVEENKCGLVVKELKLTPEQVQEIFNNLQYNKNARKTAEKYFDVKRMIRQYKEIITL